MAQRKVYRDYEEKDVREVYECGRPDGWYDLIRWLDRHGFTENRVAPGEMAHMIADAKQAAKDNVPFTANPEQAFRVMKSHRNPELVRQEEQIWLTRAAERERGSTTVDQVP